MDTMPGTMPAMDRKRMYDNFLVEYPVLLESDDLEKVWSFLRRVENESLTNASQRLDQSKRNKNITVEHILSGRDSAKALPYTVNFFQAADYDKIRIQLWKKIVNQLVHKGKVERRDRFYLGHILIGAMNFHADSIEDLKKKIFQLLIPIEKCTGAELLVILCSCGLFLTAREIHGCVTQFQIQEPQCSDSASEFLIKHFQARSKKEEERLLVGFFDAQHKTIRNF